MSDSIVGMEVSIKNFMSEQKYFQNALSDFTYEAASGGAIRHLAQAGYTVKQISEKLTFPTPYERVRKTVWQHLLATGVVLLEEPGSVVQCKKSAYLVDHDKYGRTSFRLTTSQEGNKESVHWKESPAFTKWKRNGARAEELAVLLMEKCSANGEADAYISCNFGLYGRQRKGEYGAENAVPHTGENNMKYAAEYDAVMEALTDRQREYISGLLWEPKVCYHRLDQRMREIIVRLYDAGLYHGNCYFIKLQEKAVI